MTTEMTASATLAYLLARDTHIVSVQAEIASDAIDELQVLGDEEAPDMAKLSRAIDRAAAAIGFVVALTRRPTNADLA